MGTSMLGEIQRLRGMTVAELQVEWTRLYGEPSRSRNRDYLVRRLCWRLQERELGGLSDRARARIEELAPGGFERARTPVVPRDVAPRAPRVARIRDARRPTTGTVIVREYRGRQLRLTVLDDGFELDGVVHASLSEAARAVTGSRWNGRLFWGLTERKRKA
jgi:hypothetical protein